MADESERKARRSTQYLAALIVNLGALTIGTLLGWTGQAGPKLLAGETGVVPTETELSWMAGLMPLGAAFAALPVPMLANFLGRKYTLLTAVAPLLLGFALLAKAVDVEMYYAGRFVAGVGGGAFSIVAPQYTAEIGEKSIRGALGSYYEFMLAVGVEFSYVVGGSVSVFWLSVISGVVPVVFAVLFFFMPESPYYYAYKGDLERAKKSLGWLRGPEYDPTEELKEIRESSERARKEKLSPSDFKTKAAVKSVEVAFWLMVFQQFSGANAVVFNTTSIFQAAGSELEPSQASMIVGLMQFSGNFLSTLLVDRLGRRILLLSSGFLMGASTLLLGVYFHTVDRGQSVDYIKWLPMLSLCVFMIMFSVGWGPVAWMMLGELFPVKIKSVAGAFSCAVNWTATFLVTKFFPDLVATFGRDVTFWVYTVISAIGFAFVYFGVPETKGKSLEEIQKELSGEDNAAFCEETERPATARVV
ncbi:UNVERIFIED_CONTAM: hypothetical protein PYX00_009048 [Menopon gallinae]|uniref:Major facilitator superfamily (MFS) profile domain-containing protein n=1 Tax=Menopon gallinae TaxID=328185 RepID=A0AAW2H9S2_9NEOP